MSHSESADPVHWNCADVVEWMKSMGLEEYAQYLGVKHKVDGKILLTLTESDLKEVPVSIKCLGDIKKIVTAVNTLRNSNISSTVSAIYADQHETPSDDKVLRVEYNRQRNTSSVTDEVFCTPDGGVIIEEEILSSMSSLNDIRIVELISREELIRKVESPDTYLKSLVKLVIAFAYCSISLLLTAFAMVVVHDRVPDTKLYPPLPDIVLDNVPHIPWAFDMCEVIGLILALICGIVILFHKHRVIIMRRMFSLLGTVFLLRCFTMIMTSLSVPGNHLTCTARGNTTLGEKLSEAYKIWSRMGMSIHGVRSCGDYMFSGHTTAITIICHFITEYTPIAWSGLHTATSVLNFFAVFLILAAHEHYSIDVFIAFFISSRMFLYYHAYAYNHAKITATDGRMRAWFPLGWFFEYGSIGKVNNEFEMPVRIPIPRWLRRVSMKLFNADPAPTPAPTPAVTPRVAPNFGSKPASIKNEESGKNKRSKKFKLKTK